MKALYISRHNAAVRIIHKALSKGKHGGHYTIMDAGTADHMQELSTQGNRLPAWLLPRDVLTDFGQMGCPCPETSYGQTSLYPNNGHKHQ